MPVLKKSARSHPLLWIVEPLMTDREYFDKPMFGCRGCYMRGRLVLVLAANRKPWDGLLVATDRAHHESLRAEFPSLRPHSVLGKWLYISLKDESFETTAREIVERIRRRDPRIGVESKRKVRGKRGL